MDEKKNVRPELEGEGSKTADKNYRDEAAEYLKRGQVDADAKKAEKDLDQDRAELDRAAAEGKKHSAGEDRKK